jgi:hypothetical protein
MSFNSYSSDQKDSTSMTEVEAVQNPICNDSGQPRSAVNALVGEPAVANSEFVIRPEAKSIGLSGYGGRKKQSLLTAARHNLREIQKEIGADRRINQERICLNEILAGPATAADVEALAQTLRDHIGYTPKRRDFTQAHEIVFTLPSQTKVNTSAFFGFCLAFVVAEFGQSSILSAVIHRDEEAPHMHVLLSPTIAGKYVGSALITKSSWAELVDKFALAAPKAFGVTVERTLTGPMRKQVTRAVHDGLKSLLERHISDALMIVILKAAGRNPTPFKAAMGITVTPINDGGAEFRRIALSTGKGSKRERTRKPYGFENDKSDDVPKPYGFESGSDGSKEAETILYVVSPKTPTVSTHPDWHDSHPTAPTAATPSTGDDLSHLTTTRVKDTDLATGAWDADRGEFVKAPQNGTRPTQHAIRAKAPAVAMVPGDDDRHVDRGDIYQLDFQDYEVQAWQE